MKLAPTNCAHCRITADGARACGVPDSSGYASPTAHQCLVLCVVRVPLVETPPARCPRCAGEHAATACPVPPASSPTPAVDGRCGC